MRRRPGGGGGGGSAAAARRNQWRRRSSGVIWGLGLGLGRVEWGRAIALENFVIRASTMSLGRQRSCLQPPGHQHEGHGPGPASGQWPDGCYKL